MCQADLVARRFELNPQEGADHEIVLRERALSARKNCCGALGSAEVDLAARSVGEHIGSDLSRPGGGVADPALLAGPHRRPSRTGRPRCRRIGGMAASTMRPLLAAMRKTADEYDRHADAVTPRGGQAGGRGGSKSAVATAAAGRCDAAASADGGSRIALSRGEVCDHRIEIAAAGGGARVVLFQATARGAACDVAGRGAGAGEGVSGAFTWSWRTSRGPPTSSIPSRRATRKQLAARKNCGSHLRSCCRGGDGAVGRSLVSDYAAALA